MTARVAHSAVPCVRCPGARAAALRYTARYYMSAGWASTLLHVCDGLRHRFESDLGVVNTGDDRAPVIGKGMGEVCINVGQCSAMSGMRNFAKYRWAPWGASGCRQC